MTCIVGCVQDGVVWIGGDSAGVDMNTLGIVSRSDEKVFVNDEFLFGFCGSFRTGQLVRHATKFPKKAAAKTDMAFLVTDFVNVIRECQSSHGALSRASEEESLAGGTSLLLGYNGMLYTVENDLQIGCPAEGYAACGGGAPYAVGSMYATRHVTDPIERITTALEAAAAFNAGVRAPFTILSSPIIKSPQKQRKTRKK